MPHAFHNLCFWPSLAFVCMLPGCCHEDGNVCRDDIQVISAGIDEDGNISLHFELNTRYQGALYAAMRPEGDEISVTLYTRPTDGASRKLLYSGGYHLILPWPENAAAVVVNLCGIRLDGLEKSEK